MCGTVPTKVVSTADVRSGGIAACIEKIQTHKHAFLLTIGEWCRDGSAKEKSLANQTCIQTQRNGGFIFCSERDRRRKVAQIVVKSVKVHDNLTMKGLIE